MPGATADNRNPPCLVSGYYTANIKLEVKRAVRNCDVVYCNRASRRAFGKLGERGGGRRSEVAGCEEMARTKYAVCGKYGGVPRGQDGGCTAIAGNKAGKCQEHTSIATKARHRASSRASEQQVAGMIKEYVANEAVR